MKWTEVAQAFVAVLGAAGTLLGAANLGHYRRSSVRENFKLLKELEESPELLNRNWALDFLRDRIAIDLARLSKVKFHNKKPIPWITVLITAIVSIGTAYWAYRLDINEFNWYSLIPGTISALFAMSFLGQFINRDLPVPGDDLSVEDDTSPQAEGEPTS